MRKLNSILLPLLLSAFSVCAANTPSAAEDESAALQLKLHASNEEWSVIYPKLQQIRRLREEVNAESPSSGRRGRAGGLDSPLGGTSLDTPAAPAGMVGPRRGFFGGSSIPFDPNVAPGRASLEEPLLRLLGLEAAQPRRTVNRRLSSNQGNSVGALLAELQTLAAAEGATEAQIQEKIASIRAARAKAARDLQIAQKDLEPLLTPLQLATLVSLGYLN